MQSIASVSVIYLDMDGVLVDFIGHVFRLFGVDDSKEKGEDPREQVRGWDGITEGLSRSLGRNITGEELWGKIADEGMEFWASIPWCPWGKELLEICKEVAPVVIMTTPTREPLSAAGKAAWIYKNVADGGMYALSPCKHLMAHSGALLIDDSDSNADNFARAGGMAYLFPQTWNGARRSIDYKDRLSGVRAVLRAASSLDSMLVTPSQ